MNARNKWRKVVTVLSSLLCWVVPMRDSKAQESMTDPVCGVAGGETTDLWQQTWLDLDALQEFSTTDSLTNAPQRVGALLKNVALLQRASVQEGEKVMEEIRQVLKSLNSLRPQMIDAAQQTNRYEFVKLVGDTRTVLENLQGKYSSKKRTSAAVVATLLPSKPTLTVDTKVPILEKDRRAEVRLRIKNSEGKGVGSLEFLESHTRPIHALIVDSTLQDYHHEHPVTSGAPGSFSFFFTPRKSGPYYLWIDVMPAATRRNEFLRAVLTGLETNTPSVTLVANFTSEAEGMKFRLKLDREEVKAREIVTGRLRVTDSKGRPVPNLEPVMGSFAHVVGIMDDMETMIHVHSTEDTPREYMRSGPEVLFRFIAPKAGHLKLFVQVQTEGTVKLATFSFPVL